MNVSLTPELERLVAAKVKSGMYGSSSEVVRAALRLLQQSEMEHAASLEALRRDVGIGIAQADRGELVDGDDVFDELFKRRSTKKTTAGLRNSKSRPPRRAAS